jgi:hypothetical protein
MKTNLTKTIEDALFDHLNPLLMNKKRDQRIYIAKEVTYHKKRGNGAIGRVDMMRFKPLNNSIKRSQPSQRGWQRPSPLCLRPVNVVCFSCHSTITQSQEIGSKSVFPVNSI